MWQSASGVSVALESIIVSWRPSTWGFVATDVASVAQESKVDTTARHAPRSAHSKSDNSRTSAANRRCQQRKSDSADATLVFVAFLSSRADNLHRNLVSLFGKLPRVEITPHACRDL